MKAVGYQENLPIDNDAALQDIEIDAPVAKGNDILVSVKAISVNPVDCKIRQIGAPEQGQWKIIGWDAAGVVEQVGDNVSLFKVGDKVWYAGDLSRTGSNAEYQLVDQRIVGHMPKSLSFSEAAALPLTSITAWEMLFDRLQVDLDNGDKSILVIGAAGGVGSIMVQLIKQMTKLKLIASASRPETIQWLQDLGADYIVNHRNKLSEELQNQGLAEVDYIVSLNNTEAHYPEIIKIIKPQGKFGLIDDPTVLDIKPLKSKCVSTHWEFMFTRSLFETEDMQKQYDLLNDVSEMIDKGRLKTTLGEHFGKINAANLKRAHQLIESQKAKGKIVLEGF